MDSRTERLFVAAERFYLSCSEDDRQEIERVLRNICKDPFINNKTIFAFPVFPGIFTLYRDAKLWIVFALNRDDVKVYNIGHNTSSEPSIWG